MAGKLGPPQEGRPVGDFLLRPAAMAVEGDGVAIEPRRFGPIAGLDLEKREMPAEMAVEKALPRISGEPRGQEGARRLQIAALVTDVSDAVRAMRIVRVRRD